MAARVALVLPVRTYRAAAFLDSARSLGLDVMVVSEHGSTVAGARELVVDLDRPREAAVAAAGLAAELSIDGVVGVDESAVLVAAAIGEKLRLRHHPLAAVEATRDKRRMRALLEAAGVRQPRYAVTRTAASAVELKGAVATVGGFPVVAKPVSLAASQGVVRANGIAELETAARRMGRLLDRLACDPDDDGDHPMLVESFLPGREVAVEGIVRGGAVDVVAVFDKPDPLDGPTFAETLYVTPTRLTPAVEAAVMALVVAATRALGLTDGPIHAEVRVDPMTGPSLVEVAARSIGGLCSRAVHVCAADAEIGKPVGDPMSLEEAILRHAVGMRLAERLVAAPGASGVLMLPVERAGRLLGVDGVAEARQVPGVESVSVGVPVGSEVEPLPDGDRYLGFVVASGEHPLLVERALRQAWEQLTVRLG